MRWLRIIWFLFAIVALVDKVVAQDLQRGVVRVYNAATSKWGSGFIVRIDLDNRQLWIVTAAHVVTGEDKPKVELFGNVQEDARVFFQEAAESVDYAVLVVRLEHIPDAIIPIGLDTTLPSVVRDHAQVLGSPCAGAPWSSIPVHIEGKAGHDIVFSGDVGECTSGAPLLLDNRAIGVVKQGSMPWVPGRALGAAVFDAVIPKDGHDLLSQISHQDFVARLRKIISSSFTGFATIKGAPLEGPGSKRYFSSVQLPGAYPNAAIDAADGLLSDRLQFSFYPDHDLPVEKIYEVLVRVVSQAIPQDWLDPKRFDGPGGSEHYSKQFRVDASRSGPSILVDYFEDPKEQPYDKWITLTFVAGTPSPTPAKALQALKAPDFLSAYRQLLRSMDAPFGPLRGRVLSREEQQGLPASFFGKPSSQLIVEYELRLDLPGASEPGVLRICTERRQSGKADCAPPTVEYRFFAPIDGPFGQQIYEQLTSVVRAELSPGWESPTELNPTGAKTRMRRRLEAKEIASGATVRVSLDVATGGRESVVTLRLTPPSRAVGP